MRAYLGKFGRIVDAIAPRTNKSESPTVNAFHNLKIVTFTQLEMEGEWISEETQDSYYR